MECSLCWLTTPGAWACPVLWSTTDTAVTLFFWDRVSHHLVSLALELQVGVPFSWQTYNPLSHFLSPWIFFLIYFFGDWALSNTIHIYTEPPSLSPHILSCLSFSLSLHVIPFILTLPSLFRIAHTHLTVFTPIHCWSTASSFCLLLGWNGAFCAVLRGSQWKSSVLVTTTKASFLAFCSYTQVYYPLP